MDKFYLPIQVRWSDIDQNRHLRHSAYYDYGATVRIACFSQHGLTNLKFEELRIGPILFREEAVFKREIKFEDSIAVDLFVTKATRDFSRWSVRHHFIKADGTLAAIINLDGAWMDILARKLAVPDAFIQSVFDDFPKSDDFQLIERTKK
jgi:acyl-CoA thioester hydrolase